MERPNLRPSWFKRKLLINVHFQRQFIGFALALSLGACIVFYLASTWFFGKYHSLAIEVGLRPGDPFFRVLSNMEMMLTNVFIVTSIAVVLISILGGIVFSHRVAGPLYRLRKHFEAVARGETWSNVAFREKDYFDDLPKAYNEQMRYVRERLGIAEASADTDASDSSMSDSGDDASTTTMNCEAPPATDATDVTGEQKKAS